MKIRYSLLVAAFFIIGNSNGSSLLDSYKESIQQLIDDGKAVQVSTFSDFIDGFEQRLNDESQKFMGLKSQIQSIVSFVKSIALNNSKINYNVVPDYGESFTIEADTHISGSDVPVRFTAVSDVQDNEYYAISLRLPDDLRITGVMGESMKSFESLFKNRWITFSLFAYQDSLLGDIAQGLTITAQTDAHTVADQISQDLAFVKNIIYKTVPTIQFTGSVPLAILSLIPFMVTGEIAQGIDLNLLQSLVTLKGTIPVKKTLYSNDSAVSGIKAVILDSCTVTGRWGTQSGMRSAGLGILDAFSFGCGATMRIVDAQGPEIITRGGFDMRPTGPIIYGKTDGEIKNPFGLPWISLHESGFEFPLNPLGSLITGIGLRAKVGLGEARFEVAGKTAVGFLKKTGLVLHGKAEKIPFGVFTDSVKSKKEVQESLLSSLILDHAQVSIAFGDTIIAGREFKSGIIIKAQVGHSFFDKKAGFELFAYNTGELYQLFGNGYLPIIHTDHITFEHVNTNSHDKDSWAHLGPRIEFDYRFDFAFQKFLMAKIKANGRIKIGSLFDGTADLDVSTVNLVKNSLSNFKKFFVAMLQGQKVVLKGKIFNTLGAELHILESKDKDIYIKINLSQTLLSSWEKGLRQQIVALKLSTERQIAQIDQKIKSMTKGWKKHQNDAANRIMGLIDENEGMQMQNDTLQQRIKNTPWVEAYKTVPLRAKQASNWLLIRSNGDLINTLTMHASFTADMLKGLRQLRKTKQWAEAIVRCAADIAHSGVGILGIEKIETHGWLEDIMHKTKKMYLTIELKVYGQKKVITDILLDGAHPIDSAKECIRQIVNKMF